MNKIVKAAIVLAGIVSLVLIGCAGAPAAMGPSGSASAAAEGFGGDITVTVTLENGKITAVTAEGPDETPGIGERAVNMLPAEMVSKGTVEVDALSGATYSSEGVINAAREALAKIVSGQ